MQHKLRGETNLTAWEKQVLRLLCQGYSNIEIGKMTGHSASSVGTAVFPVRDKLEIERDLRLALLRNYWERDKNGNQG